MAHQSQSSSFGSVRFNSKMTKRKQVLFLTPKISALLQSKQWIIDLTTAYNFQHWKQLFNSIESASCTSIKISQTLYSDFIFNPITYPKFTHLIKLDLTYNCLFNLQSLAFLDAPMLQELILSQTCFSSPKFLNKVNFPNLTQLCIDRCAIPEVQLSRVKLKKTFQILLLEDFEQQMTVNSDACFISKLEPQRFNKNISCFDEKRIKQSKIKEILKRKYSNYFHVKEYTEDQVQFLKLVIALADIQANQGNRDNRDNQGNRNNQGNQQAEQQQQIEQN